jgi:hypothetical protein
MNASTLKTYSTIDGEIKVYPSNRAAEKAKARFGQASINLTRHLESAVMRIGLALGVISAIFGVAGGAVPELVDMFGVGGIVILAFSVGVFGAFTALWACSHPDLKQ